MNSPEIKMRHASFHSTASTVAGFSLRTAHLKEENNGRGELRNHSKIYDGAFFEKTGKRLKAVKLFLQNTVNIDSLK